MELIKKIILLSAAVIACHGLCTAQSVRLMSMNLKEGGEYIGHRAKPYADLIKEYNPDFVCLQEVDYYTVRNGKSDMLDSLALQTGMFPFYCKSFDYQGGGFGVAVLSKYPFFNAGKIVSSIAGTREPRGTGWVCVQLPGGEVVRVGSVHLAVENYQAAIKQFAELNKVILTDSETPTLLAGDFNCPPDGDAVTYVKVKWQEIARGSGNTIPSSGPTTQLDYVMGHPKKWTYSNYQIIARPDLSDHCFVVADVSYEK